MRIQRLSITAYGTLVDRRLDLSTGLTVIHGSNEAGKTTLKRYIETLLYGFDDSDVSQYLPWRPNGNAFGGELCYELNDGQVFLARRHYDNTVRPKKNAETAVLLIGADGTGGQAELPPSRIGDVHLHQHRTIFRTVFAVDLGALVAMKALEPQQQEELSQVFFRELSTLGEVANPSDVLARLTARAQEYGKFAGRGGPKVKKIEACQKALSQARSDLSAARKAAEEAERLANALSENKEARTNLTARRRTLMDELNRRQNLGPAAQVYPQLIRTRARLQESADLAGVSDDVLRQVQRTADERAAMERLVEQYRREREAALRQLSSQREQLEALAPVLRRVADIERLMGECDEQERLATHLPHELADLDDRRTRLVHELKDLVRTAEPTECPGLNLSATERENLVAAIDQYEERSTQKGALNRYRDDLNTQIAQLDPQIETLHHRVPDDFPPKYRSAQLRELLSIQREVDLYHSEENALKERHRQLEADRQQMELIRKEVAQQTGLLRKAAPPLHWVGAGATLLVGLAALVYYAKVQQAIPAFGGLLLTGIALAMVYNLYQRRRTAIEADELVSTSTLLQSQRDRIQRGEKHLAEQTPSLEETRKLLVDRCAIAGLGDELDADEIEEAVLRLQRFDDVAADFRRLAELRQQRQQLSRLADERKAELDRLDRELEQLTARIQKGFTEAELIVPDDWKPAVLRNRIERLARLGERWAEMRREQGRLLRLREQHERFLTDVHRLADDLPELLVGNSPVPLEQPFAFVRHAAGLVRRHISLQDRLEGLQAHLEPLERRIAEIEEALARTGRTLDEHLHRLNLETPDALPALQERLRERRETEASLRTLSEQFEHLRRIAGLPDDWMPETVESSPTPEGEPSAENLRRQLDEIETDLSRLADEASQLTHDLSEKEAAMPLAVAQGAVEAATDDWVKACERFDALVLACHMLERAMKRYQQERQPAIIRTAQHHLRRLTAGKYDTLQTDLLEGSQKLGDIYVVPHRDQQRDSEAFSRGTREQVYLSLRLALCDELGKLERLPIILDDVLVNFDDVRLQATADLIADLGRDRQVIYLTCHQATLKAFAERDATVLEL